MLKFVQKWLRERKDEAEIEQDGTRGVWTKCEDGLPSSDRKVEAMIYSPAGYRASARMDVCFAQFNPHIGWKMDREAVVIAWRDMEKEYRDMINDLSWAKLITCES